VLTFRLDRHSPIPLYYQLQRQLREAIDSGVLTANSALPTEPELASQLGISRFTVRQAMEQLVRDGLIRRERGRGTFVAEPPASAAVGRPYSFAEDLDSQGLDAHAPVLRLGPVTPPVEARTALGATADEPVLEIVRLRSRGGRPVAVEISLVPANLVPGLTVEALTDTSLYDVLERRYGITVTTAEEELRLVALEDEVARWLDVPPGTPGCRIERVTWDDNRVIELRYSHLATDSVRFRVSVPAHDRPRALTP
jgi:GntR family transcriptional regulator